jgi:ABC-type branched-subunit amino acid transport system substrate-binding protein
MGSTHRLATSRKARDDSKVAISLNPGRREVDSRRMTNAPSRQDASVIKIGAIAATSGPAGRLGNSFVKALRLAQEELPHTVRQYQLVVEEIPSPDRAEPAIEKLIGIEKVDALIVGLSISGQIVKPYATAAKIPLFCICSVSSVGDELYTFTTMPLAEDEASRWVAEARRRGIRTIARLTQEYPSIENHVRALKAEAAPAGIAFVYEERFEASRTDFRSSIAAAQRSSPDVYFVEAFNPALDLLGQQLGDAGLHNLASVVAFSLSDKPELFEDGWYTDSYVSPDFNARLERKYPTSQLATHMMPYAYDSFNMLVQGFESGEDILSYVRRMTEYQGTAGRITKQAGTGNFRSAPALWVIQHGKPTLAERA